MMNCPTCDGRGSTIAAIHGRDFNITCPQCNGYGKIPTEEEKQDAVEFKSRHAQDQEGQVADSKAPVDTRGEQSSENNRRRGSSNTRSERGGSSQESEGKEPTFKIRFIKNKHGWHFTIGKKLEQYSSVVFDTFGEAANHF